MAHYNRYTQQTYSEYNKPFYERNDYNNAYNPEFNKQLSRSAEPDIEYEETYHYLAVSSRDRDASVYPNVNNYVVNFQKEFKNISSIELVQAIIPDKNSVTEEPYILLKISELEDVMFSNDRNISDAFAILQPASPVTTDGFIQIDRRIHENTVKYYKTPKANLSKMTITLTNYAGVPFDFGTDVTPPQKELQNTFIFKIVCLDKRRGELGQRNVF